MRLHRPQSRENLITKLFGSSLLAGALHCLGEHHPDPTFAVAIGAVGQMLRNVRGVLTEQFVVEVLLQLCFRFIASAVCQFSSFAETLSPRSAP